MGSRMTWNHLDSKVMVNDAFRVCSAAGFQDEHVPMWSSGCPVGSWNRVIQALDASPMLSVYLWGPTGAGKTGMLSSMMKLNYQSFAMRGTSRPWYMEGSAYLSAGCWYLTHRQLVRRIHAQRDGDNSYADIVRSRILIIDDFGEFQDDSGGYNLGELKELIDHRYTNRLTTWIASNFEPKTLMDPRHAQWGPILARMQDRRWMLPSIKIDGPNRRKEADHG